jgi:hypothetical protein
MDAACILRSSAGMNATIGILTLTLLALTTPTCLCRRMHKDRYARDRSVYGLQR